MTKHELTDEKIEELWNEAHVIRLHLNPEQGEGIALKRAARAAYDLGKQAREDDGFIPCTFDEIREGDTVERTVRYSHGTVVTTVGVVDRLDSPSRWVDSIGLRIASDYDDTTYRRKPAKVTPPDPEKHPIILDEGGDAWAWDGDKLYKQVGVPSLGIYPIVFGNNWSPAKIVAKEDD